MATIYICKCGRRVRKSTNADNTGNRDTAGCRGCPYLLPWGPTQWDATRHAMVTDVKGYECRMSPSLDYATYYQGGGEDKCVLHIYSLDYDFLDRVTAWAAKQFPDKEISCSFDRSKIRATEFIGGLYGMSVYPMQNKKGMAAKAALIERFFGPDGRRLDKTPEEEKAHVLAAIEAGKAMAQERKENMDYIISKHEATGRLYAYYKGSFWFWDSHIQRWLLSQFAEDLYQEYRKNVGDFTREDMLAETSAFYLLDDYEVSPNCIETLLQCNPKTAIPAPASAESPEIVDECSEPNCTCSDCKRQDCTCAGGCDAGDRGKCDGEKNCAQDGCTYTAKHQENPTPAAPVSPVDAGAAAQSLSDAEPVSLETDECTENPTSLAAATAAAEETVADDVCPYLELIENSKKYSCQCSICGDRFVNTEICNKTFLSCGWYLDQQDKDALNHSEENTDKDNCLCRTCGSEECPGRGCNKECPNGSDGSCFTATCPGYIERTDIICKDKATNAPSVDAAATSDEETRTTPAAASGAALESLHAQSALPQNAPAQDIAADAPSALGFDYSGLDDQTVADLHLAEREYSSGKKMAEMGLRRMADAVAIAHDALCGSCDKLSQLKHGNRGENAFGTWCESIGIHRKAAERLLQVAKLMDSSTPREEKVLEELSPSLLYAAAKPSAPAELVQAVKDGDITTHKQFKELEAKLKAEREAREKAEQEAAMERKEQEDANAAAQRYKAECDRRARDQQRLEEQAQTARLERKAAEQRANDAERRAQAAEAEVKSWEADGQKMQEIVDDQQAVIEKQKIRIGELESGITVETTAADQEEIERRANELSEPLVKIIDQQNAQIERMASGNTVAVQASVLEQYIESMKASLLGNASRVELACYDVRALDSLAGALREFADSIDGIFEDRSEDND